MIVVLDTNVLLISIPSKSKYRPIFSAIINGQLDLIISNDILLEYAEVVADKTNPQVSTNLCQLLATLHNVIRIEPFFKWNLISQDPDDNKFVDSAISGSADYLVTNDKHFDGLKKIGFPKVEVIRAEDFLQLITTSHE